MEDGNEGETVRILCSKLILFQKNETGLQWLIGSPFYSPFTVVSTFKCIHNSPLQDSFSPDYQKESEDLQTLLLKGFEIIGAMIIGKFSLEQHGREAIDAARKMRNLLSQGKKVLSELIIGAVADSDSSEVQFFLSRSENSTRLDSVTSFKDENDPKKFIWENGCLLRCELPVKLPFYFPLHDPPEMEKMFIRSTEAVVAKLQDAQVVYLVEPLGKSCDEGPRPVIVRGSQLDFQSNLSNFKLLTENALNTCGHLCTRKASPTTFSADARKSNLNDSVKVSVLLNCSKNSATPTAPVAEFLPATEEARLMVVSFRLEVLCYAAKALRLIDAITMLIIPGLVDQLISMRNTILPNLLKKHPQLRPYHFCPPGSLHPITVIYELSYGETEMKQVDIRKSLHLRLGLPFDRPLLRIANALDLPKEEDSMTRKGSILKDVHVGIPSSGVSGGSLSLVQGSYEYYHYLQNGYNDSGWGCAYRSLQTIISWFRLQQYTSVDVPSHREIQETLVEIGDKDSSFIGSREWIGAIELSFVLDKLLGVSCKVINVRSGAELPEKCRELAFHFENQGTPIMIGGGVLAYTLLGIDFNETSGDCAFLILDPHYTGGDEHKKIVNGGWCGWKKAVDNKGKNFFLHDKFYNLLLPQRPYMV